MKFGTISAAITLTFISAGSTLVWLPQAKSQPTGQTYEAALVNAKERIAQGRSITIVDSDIVDNNTNYPDHPKDRPLSIEVILDGNAADSVMLSAAFQKAITSENINSGRYQTEWGCTYGLMPDGTIQDFKCVGYGLGENTIPEGQEFGD